ncbi:MAG: UDP-N-acetylglucosamine--N-acetylmuramyl-(pentapeptide) pyrophosphoryl-undecaprenol N-acetylglucosamine transferase [Candidatus Pacebacteria bacterium]|nr:UDP-N-acetylglucosamine--N-acetylmuramyl-(pentapeptide) pyrophosphoryl-undecaprenol N-acetylglucosamine transferase [Candidatus Paceibacterota bacterium]
MKIVFTGGGTAGHIFPILAVVREIKRNYPDKKFQFFYIGPKDKKVKPLLLKEGIAVKTILAGKIRRYFSIENFIDILIRAPIGIIQSFFHIFMISPDLIFSKGGYGSLPVVLAGWVLITPIFLHESDASFGLTNRISAKLSIEVFTSFPVKKDDKMPLEKIISVGNPIRKEILEGSKEQGRKIFNLTGQKPVILILGGSQGAQRINDRILLALSEMLESFEVIHQTGEKNFQQVRKEADVVVSDNLKKYYHPHPFLNEEELASSYKSADFIISRAGAGSIFEIAANGKPSILVPLTGSAQDHQVKNAYAYSQYQSAVVIEESNFTPNFLLSRLKHFFSKPDELKRMSDKAKEFSRPQAAEIIADYLVYYLVK